MKYISWSVTAAHLCLLLLMMFGFSISRPTPPKKLTVNTFTPKMAPPPVRKPPVTPAKAPAPSQKQVPPKPQPNKKTDSAKKLPSSPKKEPAKPSPSPRGKPKAAPITKREPAAPPIPTDLLQELEESIAKIEQKRDKLYQRETERQSPLLDTLHVDIDLSLNPPLAQEAEGYYDQLIAVLHGALNLPDFGEVKVQLVVRADGSLETMKIIKSESEKNKRYLEKHLPLLRFPCFDSSVSPQKKQIFVLTFCNEI